MHRMEIRNQYHSDVTCTWHARLGLRIRPSYSYSRTCFDAAAPPAPVQVYFLVDSRQPLWEGINPVFSGSTAVQVEQCALEQGVSQLIGSLLGIDTCVFVVVVIRTQRSADGRAWWSVQWHFLSGSPARHYWLFYRLMIMWLWNSYWPKLSESTSTVRRPCWGAEVFTSQLFIYSHRKGMCNVGGAVHSVL